MLDIGLIASDVDGTMMPRGGHVSDNLRRAVARCRERGIPFIISSGRWIGAIQAVVRAAGTEDMPMILTNGAAVVRADGETLRECLMDERDAGCVYDILRRFNVQINGYVRNGLYCLNTHALKKQSAMIAEYIGMGHAELVLDDRDAFEQNVLPRAYKIEGLTDDPELILEVRAALKDTGLAVTHSSGRNVEIMASGVGKGAAIRWLAGEMNIPLENCMAFGDNENDRDMLETVGWPVVVANGAPGVKAIARMIAPSDVEDGVARVIFEHVLGEAI